MQVLLSFVLTLAIAVISVKAVTYNKIEPVIYETLKSKHTVNILVSFKTKTNFTALKSSFKIQRSGRSGRKIKLAQDLYHSLKTFADQAQAKVLNSIQKTDGSNFTTETATRFRPKIPRYRIRQLWITNQLFIKNADKILVENLQACDEISSITQEKFIPFPEITKTSPNFLSRNFKRQSSTQWGVEIIGAPQVWAKGIKGAGVVVANIDSGVRGSHEALRQGFRKHYGWFDAIDETTLPFDDSGHGTHTMGTIAGRTHGIGVAPDAEWIACRACNKLGCFKETLLLCGQWILCPTDVYGKNPRCDLTPKIVSNSWVPKDNPNFFNEVIEMWRRVGIVSFFASGNTGNSCGTVMTSAGSTSDAVVVGATNSQDMVSFFSSVGPTSDGRIKPDVVAPGSHIVSAGHSSDVDYISESGSSQACPHAAGVAALMFSKNQNLTPEEVRLTLIKGATPTAIGVGGKNRGDIVANIFQNNHAGWGRINATNSVNLL